MAASTVNIADFRYRDMKGSFAPATQRSADNPGGLKIVEPQTAAEQREPGTAADNAGAENPAVRDISTMRDKPHVQRLVLRPALISRNRSNLVRFNEPHVTVMKVKHSWAVQSWASVEDDYDHPPAA